MSLCENSAFRQGMVLPGLFVKERPFFSSPGVHAWVPEATDLFSARFSGLREVGFSPRRG